MGFQDANITGKSVQGPGASLYFTARRGCLILSVAEVADGTYSYYSAHKSPVLSMEVETEAEIFASREVTLCGLMPAYNVRPEGPSEQQRQTKALPRRPWTCSFLSFCVCSF